MLSQPDADNSGVDGDKRLPVLIYATDTEYRKMRIAGLRI